MLTGDPTFVSAVDYHLQAGSPAINAGVDVGLTSDYEYNIVPWNGGYDIGVYEYGSFNSVNINNLIRVGII